MPSRCGTILKTPFTIAAFARYDGAMLLIAAAALANVHPPHSGPVVEARATVRIVSGVRLKWGDKPGRGVPPPRDTMLVLGGSATPARLIEFE